MFNLLLGRDLQQMNGQPPQQCFLMPLLPGTDGVQKMSKSLGNYIGIDEPPNDMFGKTMSLPDTMIESYFEFLTDVPDAELAEIAQVVESGSANPMDIKKRLASDLVTQFHGRDEARQAQAFFESTVQRRQTPDDMPEFALDVAADPDKRLSAVIVEAGFAASAAEARRLINQGAVRLDDQPVSENLPASRISGGILRVGRRRFLRLSVEQE